MSDSKENKKKGFFSRLFGGSSAPEEPKKEEIRIEDNREMLPVNKRFRSCFECILTSLE